MGKPTIALFNPYPGSDYRGVPLSLLGPCRKLARREDVEIRVLSEAVHPDYEQLLADLARKAELLCLGVTSMTGEQIRGAVRAATAVKSVAPAVPVVAGGFHPSILPTETLADERFDVVAHGQGEQTFPELVDALLHGTELSRVAGISYRGADGRIRATGQRPLARLDDLPRMPYELVDVRAYLRRDEFGDRCLDYITAYGCGHRCGFCAEQVVNRRRWNALSAERVVEEIADLVGAYGADALFIRDSDFFASERRVLAISEGLLRRGVEVALCTLNGRTDTLSRYESETWAAMQQANVREILVGAESGLPEALELIGKRAKVEHTLRFARLATEHGIMARYSFLVGLPGLDLREELAATLRTIHDLLTINPEAHVMVFVYTPYPGTPLYERSISLGLRPPQRLEEWSTYALGTANVPWIPRDAEGLVGWLVDTVLFRASTGRRDYLEMRGVRRLVARLQTLAAGFRVRFGILALPAIEDGGMRRRGRVSRGESLR